MATLVLTAVGGAIGGPIGAALGAAVGGAVDRATIFKAKRREGPRLTELAVQTSSYGSAIPRLFGTMRVAGSVIWATDLIEQRSTDGGGKSGGGTVSYSYSASFAVLLSARPIRAVKRIWADGKLLRGEAGDFKAPVTFRLHLGGEDQAADPLIVSAEGAGVTPACRGQAYAVFEMLALADYGNRIPSLTFEVEADAEPVTIGAVVEAVSDGLVAGGGVGTTLGGYSAYGDSLRAVIDGLAEAGGAWFVTEGERLALRAGAGSAVELIDDGVGDEDGGKRGVRSFAPADTAPARLAVAYYDVARDYQTGLQRADRPGAGPRAARIELPAVLDAASAKALAGAALARADTERERRTLALDCRRIGLAPGDRVMIAGEAGRWRVTSWTLEAMVLRLELVRIARAAAPANAAPGRVTGAPDLPAGTTRLHVFEIPPFDDAVLSAPRLMIAAAGTGPGWRSATLQLSTDGGARWTPIGSTRGIAVMGTILTPAGDAPATLIDRRHGIEIELANDAMALADADAAAMQAGINLALAGDELIQFGEAERIAGRHWRVRELWRGRRGTEWASAGMAAGRAFVLLDPANLATIDLPVAMLGGVAQVMAAGVGDTTPVTATLAPSGASVRPPSPAHPTVTPLPGGTLVGWTRRSRAGWRWIDHVDAPLAEDGERYAVAVLSGGVQIDRIETGETSVWIPADADAAEVRQIGSMGYSRPLRIALPS